ncbi:class I SAM-dependent methyltransferase [Phytoactinopolyspora halotolerans]|uniref:Class I SAM-dependent methyltransferase n=1 Tax=Phytoactinopolyspora halotolerans TaxID=1981512 RepID=A0A6L9SD01_9ACTN|nr:class I SAM-dependent methyltransferase [Phytoactinopolyspora halotolerans]NEE02899.1 class I SAM-dependent methyltransferase [Phytoactinopolyspora halotolerans]
MRVEHAAPDGSPVGVYLAIPAGKEPEIIHSSIASDADILELGCGVGRLTRVLLAYGHDVVGVDNDPVMLAHVTGAETVHADFYDLDLGRRFGAVVAASHLVNTPGEANRIRLLEVCARHVRDDGVVLVERYPPAWSEDPHDSSGMTGPVASAVSVHRKGPDGFSATVEYRLGERRWQHDFTAEHVDDAMMIDAAAKAGLRFADWVDDAQTWARLLP